MTEDGFANGEFEDVEEDDRSVCEECESYQQEIYRLNHLLRTDLKHGDTRWRGNA
jgi:hypothetical protein